MEAVAYVAGETWSAHPVCACPVITAFMVSWNDGLSQEDRDRLLLPLIPRLVGTRGSNALASRRATMATDWLVREQAPARLRLAGLAKEADDLAALPEITDFAKTPSIKVPLEAARSSAYAARAAAWDVAWDVAWDAAGGAAWDAARAAAMDAARAAAWDASWDAAGAAAGAAVRAAAKAAAWDAARAAAWDAARAATWDAARAAAMDAAKAAAWDAARAAWDAARAAAMDAARDALKPTTFTLQASALKLIDRMIEAKDE